MIVREENFYRFDAPRVFKHPFYRPMGINETLDVSDHTYDTIIFAPEYDTDVHDPDVYVKVWDVPWRWHCRDCYAACGDWRHIFKTDWAKREDLGGKGNRNIGGFSEPTYTQQLQMADHAKQHQIMYQWAKGLK